MLELLTLKPDCFSLDISDLSLKVMKLKKNKGVFDLACFGETKIPEGIIQEGEIKDEEKLVEIVKKAVQDVHGETLKTRDVVASLPEEKSFIQVIQMPLLAEQELKKAVIFEAENYIPLSVDDVYLDSQVIPPVRNHLDHKDVLIVAVPKKIVDPYISVLKKSGLTVQALEVETQSISRAVIKDKLSLFPVLLIDFGATRTSFMIFSGHSLSFTSGIPISSQKFTEAISKTLKCDIKKAEKLKIEHGLLGTDKKVFDSLIPPLTDLNEQIKNFIHYYQTHSFKEHLDSKNNKIEKILLCGGGANLKGLTDFLSLELKMPVETANPWINVFPGSMKKIPSLSFQESLSYATAIGLAIKPYD